MPVIEYKIMDIVIMDLTGFIYNVVTGFIEILFDKTLPLVDSRIIFGVIPGEFLLGKRVKQERIPHYFCA